MRINFIGYFESLVVQVDGLFQVSHEIKTIYVSRYYVTPSNYFAGSLVRCSLVSLSLKQFLIRNLLCFRTRSIIDLWKRVKWDVFINYINLSCTLSSSSRKFQRNA